MCKGMSNLKDFTELRELLDRTVLNDNQLKFLVADVLVGYIPLDIYLSLANDISQSRISTNARKIVDYVNNMVR